MTKKAKFWIGIISLIIVVVIVGIVFSFSGEKATKEKSEKGVIKIGLSSAMSGEAASYGEGYFAGAFLAVEEINREGGINGRKIKLIVEDDKCNAEGGASAFSKLVNVDKVVAIVGPLCSAAGGAGLPIAQRNGIPSIIVASAPNLTKIGDFIFRNYPSDAFQGKFAAKFIYNSLGKRKAAVIFVKNDWGQGLRDEFVKTFTTLGGEIVYDEGVLQNSADLRTQITKAKASGAEVLYFPVYPQGAVVGLKQLKELGFKGIIVGSDNFADNAIIKLPEAEGVLYVVPQTNNPPEFQEKVRITSGKTPNIFTPYGYDAVKILATAIQKAGTNKKAIRDEISRMVYKKGVALPVIKFDQNGDLASAKYQVKVIKGGKSENFSQ